MATEITTGASRTLNGRRSAQQMKKTQLLPFADAPNIVRAHQKDSYFESILRAKVQETLQLFTGQRFIHTHPEELTVFAKALYLGLTTLIGSRTLGEEYTDLIYVSRNGKRLPNFVSKIGFIMSYAILPYLVSRLIKKKLGDEDEHADDSWLGKLKGLSYSKILDSLMNLHLAVFYITGSYYNLSKRVFGLRYAFGHKVNPGEGVSNGGYEFLGGLIFLQFIFKAIRRSNELLSRKPKEKSTGADEGSFKVTGVPSPDDPSYNQEIDLSNPKLLKYIPENSRKCMLCLSFMTNPACSPCGHVFCWGCISDWSREHPECPLCRQHLSEQSLLPLR